MKHILITLIVVFAGLLAEAGVVGRPVERIVLPAKSGSYLVRVWDDTAGDWSGDFENLTGYRYYDFQFPEWGKMYWIGLWDADTKEFVFGRWVGQMKTDDRKSIID